MRILMVCLGNICRSPMAEGILRQKTNGTSITVDSAGTSSYHEGENPDTRAVINARRHGVDIASLIARPFEVEDFDRFDRIYVMDLSNLKKVQAMARNEEDLAKVDLLMNEVQPGSDIEVPDPYFGGDEGFEHVFGLLNSAADAILKKYGGE